MRVLFIVLCIFTFACKKSSTPNAGSAAPPTPAAGSAVPAGSAAPAVTAVGASNQLDAAVKLECDQKTMDLPGEIGTAWYMTCPACTEMGKVRGTDYYTDDSPVCTAAVHAGVLQKSGGTVLVTWIAGQKLYPGSTRNGITTSDMGPWGRSFFVQSVDASGKPTSAAPTLPAADVWPLSCQMSVAETRIDVGGSAKVLCPPGCTADADHEVWGTDVYAARSAACVAAIHAGVITAAKGGLVTMKMGGPQKSFKGSERNGIKSQDSGESKLSLTFEK